MSKPFPSIMSSSEDSTFSTKPTPQQTRALRERRESHWQREKAARATLNRLPGTLSPESSRPHLSNMPTVHFQTPLEDTMTSAASTASGDVQIVNADNLVGQAESLTWTYSGTVIIGTSQPHGHGKIEWNNGTRYVGQFKNGVMHGPGVCWFVQGYRHEGMFREGRPAGEGVVIYTSGDQFQGTWTDGKRHGTFAHYHAEQRRWRAERWNRGALALKGPWREPPVPYYRDDRLAEDLHQISSSGLTRPGRQQQQQKSHGQAGALRDASPPRGHTRISSRPGSNGNSRESSNRSSPSPSHNPRSTPPGTTERVRRGSTSQGRSHHVGQILQSPTHGGTVSPPGSSPSAGGGLAGARGTKPLPAPTPQAGTDRDGHSHSRKQSRSKHRTARESEPERESSPRNELPFESIAHAYPEVAEYLQGQESRFLQIETAMAALLCSLDRVESMLGTVIRHDEQSRAQQSQTPAGTPAVPVGIPPVRPPPEVSSKELSRAADHFSPLPPLPRQDSTQQPPMEHNRPNGGPLVPPPPPSAP